MPGCRSWRDTTAWCGPICVASASRPRCRADIRGRSIVWSRISVCCWIISTSRACHLVGAKIGGTIARAFAARRPERLITLTVVGTPPPLRAGAAERVPELIRDFETHGVEYWARQNMDSRLGSSFPPEGFEWWVKFMGRTAVSTQIGFMGTIACADIRADLAKITCPTLVITTEQSGLATVEETRAWQQQIADSELLVLPGNSYHVAATHADRAAEATLDFLARRGGG